MMYYQIVDDKHTNAKTGQVVSKNDQGDRGSTHGKTREERDTRFSPSRPLESSASLGKEEGPVGDLFRLWGARGSNLSKKVLP